MPRPSLWLKPVEGDTGWDLARIGRAALSGTRGHAVSGYVTVLLVCLVAAAYMAGLSWFVGVVHYPLFAGVVAAGWRTYHRRHSDRTTVVVLAPMVAELVAAAWIAVDRPADVGASRLHRRIGDPLDSGAHRTLLAVHHARTALWSARAARRDHRGRRFAGGLTARVAARPQCRLGAAGTNRAPRDRSAR